MKLQRVLPLVVLTLLALLLGACPPRSPGNLEMTVSHQKFQTEIRMLVEGKNYTPNGPVTITITNFPRKTGNITRNRVADAAGNFSLLETFSYTQTGRDEVFVNILVTGRDEKSGQFKITDVSAEPYLIR
jgi:hypothetical protein